jgi:proline iminopeptidase
VNTKSVVALVALVVVLTSCGQSTALSVDGTPTIHEVEVQAPDVTLHARIAGDPQAGNVLIAVHGGPGNSSDYMLSLEQLASNEFAVVTYDQRGTGQSTEPVTGGYAMEDYIADLEAVRQAVGADTVHVLGHSWGGLVAVRYAVAHPQHVRSIIFAGSGVPDKQALQAGQANMAQRRAALQTQGVIPQQITSIADLLPAYFSDPGFDIPDELKHMSYNPQVEQMTWSALGDYDFTAGVDRLDQLVLVLFGADDPFRSPFIQSTESTLSAAKVEFVVLYGCGHYWQECPDQFFSRVRAFLESLPKP